MIPPAELEHNMQVEYRVGRDVRGTVDWSVWRQSALYVSRREREFRRGGRTYPAGEITALTVQAINWAEYDESAYDAASDTWLVEDYYLQMRRPTDA